MNCLVYEQEYAVTAVDVLARRTRLAFVDAAAASKAASRVVEIMAELLHWNRARRAQELADCTDFLATMSAGVHTRQSRGQSAASQADTSAKVAGTVVAPAAA